MLKRLVALSLFAALTAGAAFVPTAAQAGGGHYGYRGGYGGYPAPYGYHHRRHRDYEEERDAQIGLGLALGLLGQAFVATQGGGQGYGAQGYGGAYAGGDPFTAIMSSLLQLGYSDVRPYSQSEDDYWVQARDAYGQPVWLRIDARTGQVQERVYR